MALLAEGGGGELETPRLLPQLPVTRSPFATPLSVRGPVDIHPIQPASAAAFSAATRSVRESRSAQSAAQPTSAARLAAARSGAAAIARTLNPSHAPVFWGAETTAAEPSPANAQLSPPGSAPSTPTSYYTYRDNVLLKAGQTVGYTPGKGYYAKGAGSGPALIQQVSDAASGGGYPSPPPTPTGYYTYRDNVPLKAGQTVGYTAGKGYYAKGKGTGPALIQQVSDAASGGGYTPARPKPKPTNKTRAGSSSGTTSPSAPPHDGPGTSGGTGSESPKTRARRPESARTRQANASARTTARLRPIAPGVKIPPVPTRHPGSPSWATNAGRELFAFRYLSSQLSPPLKPFHVAAIVGNMMKESLAVLSKKEPTPTLVSSLHEYGGSGYGIAQWTEPSRVAGLHEFASDHHLAVSNFGLQLAYVALELRTGGRLVVDGKPIQTLKYHDTLQRIRATATIRDATTVVMNDYETPDPNTIGIRTRYANEVLALAAHKRPSKR